MFWRFPLATWPPACPRLCFCARGYELLTWLKIKGKKKQKNAASSRPPVDMNNGGSSTTTGIWWVKHLMDDWWPVLVPHSSSPYVRYTAPQNPKHMSKLKLYLYLTVPLLECSAQVFAIQFPEGGGFGLGLICLVFFSWLFLCCLLSRRPWEPPASLHRLCSKLNPDSNRMSLWSGVLLEATCVNLGVELVGVQSCRFVIINFSLQNCPAVYAPIPHFSQN